MSLRMSLVIVVVVWAAIYLPWLGTPELRSEEGHRVLPAVEMLDSGDYIVPHIGGQPYLAKPPLVNWKIAAAFWLTGVRNEWTARLPSVVHVLFAAIVIATSGRVMLGNGAGVAALVWLTNLGMIEKGRMIEIDAIYVSIFAIAFVSWLAFWVRGCSRWLTWIVPWVFLGFGLLAKGPAHLIFFYALLIAILWRTKQLRELLQPAHAIGVLLMIAIFAAWALPCFRAVAGNSIADTWKYELGLRLTGGENAATYWPMNFPRGFGYFLPWLFVLPFIRIRNFAAEHRDLAVGLALGAVVPFVVVLLLPGTIPRYILPTLVPVCLLIGLAVRDGAFEWRIGSATINERFVWSFIALFVILSGVVFAARSATTLMKHPKVRPIAAQVNAVVPPNETLFAVKPLFQPYLFYVHSPIHYVNDVYHLPSHARFFVTGPTEVDSVDRAKADMILETPQYRGHSTTLFRAR